jgi:carboxymethylenebutenolidase
VARPANAGAALPVVLVVHENRGLNPHIEDIARRLAVDNFIAVAPDALSPSGGYPGDEDKARGAFDKLDAAKTSEDFVAATTWARTVAGGNGKVGAVGFCWGGTIVNFIATRSPELVAGAPFYGAAPPLDAVKNIKAEMMMVFAENDARVNATWPPYEGALKAAGVRHSAFIYPGTQHGFNNDTTPRYDEKAAQQAWARTLALFNRTLRA